MKRVLTTAAALSLGATAATAGGIDRSGQFLGFLFEEGGDTGGYVQFSFGSVSPSADSAGMNDPLGAYQPYSVAFKQRVNENFSFGLIMDEPFGADVSYTAGPFAGGGATVDTTAITALGRYEFGNGFSVHGGVRMQRASGQIVTRFGATPAQLVAGSDFQAAPVIGVAYERPEIALRVALTYNGAVTNKLDGTENGAPTSFDVKWPESWNLEFQTGIAQDTLLFGSIRYAAWDGFNVTTTGVAPLLGAGPRTYVNFTGNTTTYSLGVGRRINENWAAAVTLGFEEAGNRPTTTPLAPTTGSTSIGLGVTYTQGNTKVTGGITYAKLGDQTLPAAGANWNDNEAIGAGIRVGISF